MLFSTFLQIAFEYTNKHLEINIAKSGFMRYNLRRLMNEVTQTTLLCQLLSRNIVIITTVISPSYLAIWPRMKSWVFLMFIFWNKSSMIISTYYIILLYMYYYNVCLVYILICLTSAKRLQLALNKFYWYMEEIRMIKIVMTHLQVSFDFNSEYVLTYINVSILK